ncbi:hypothetical protein F0562_010611 [Nyssa sinensis]|uniref:Receptor ligand binding region domain-containing protein n=1 Tax=Nyssa sinensis TaxID=561372 RepID=A0A5J5A1U1_9ASTE|nr:hypothetical protein F0562_010611 [Nyssa sinensis]
MAIALLFCMDLTHSNHVKGFIGVIVDSSSRIAKHLINTDRVQAVLGPRTWEEASRVAELSTQSHVPVLSLADSTPPWATKRWPFLIQASPSKYAQMKTVVAIVQSWGWRRTILIYEDIDPAANGVIPHLSDALREVGAEIIHFVALPPFASSLSEELEKLKRQQCRVLVVHSSLPLALRLFEMAKKMKMIEKDYVWITTDSTTSLVHSISNKATAISSIQGVLGVMSYFPEIRPHFQDFHTRFRRKFSTEHPEEENHEPGIFALEAYDATWVVALAMEEGNRNGQHLLDKILSSEFNGLSGKVQFTERKLARTHIFQIINVIGKNYRELGYWSEELGFSETIDGGAVYNASMENLEQVFWPGAPWTTPRGWTLPTVSNPLRIGVPNGSLTNRFVKVEYDHSTNNYSFTGFSIKVFKEAVEHLPYSLPYEFIPFEGKYDDLVKQVHLKRPSSKFLWPNYSSPSIAKAFITAGPTYKVGGYGFTFPKGSPMLPDMNEALLNITEKGVLRELENSLTASEKCVDVEADNENVSLSPSSFWVLFTFSTATSTAALVIYIVSEKWRIHSFLLELRCIWMLISVAMIHWWLQKRRFSRRVGDAGSPSPVIPQTYALD